MELEEIKKEIESYSAEKSIKLVEGVNINSIKGNFLYFEDFKILISFVVESKKSVLFFNYEKFGESFFEDSKEKYDETMLNELKEQYIRYFDKINYLELFILCDGALCLFSKTSEWFDNLQEELKTFEEESEESIKCKDCGNPILSFSAERGEEYCVDCIEKKRKEGEEKIKDLAKVLAEDKDFNLCKNETERKIYLENKYPELDNDRFVNLFQLSERTRALISMQKRGMELK